MRSYFVHPVATSVAGGHHPGGVRLLVAYAALLTLYVLWGSRDVTDTCIFGRQDTFVYDLFRHRGFAEDYRGYYLDIGAHHGVVDSTTFMLDRLGWRGLCVDPLPVKFEGRSCALARVVVTDRSGQAVRFLDCKVNGTDWGAGGLSGLRGFGTASHDVSGCAEVDMVTLGAAELLKDYSVPRVIDFLSLDVEGAEYLVVHALSRAPFCARVWAIEHNGQEPKRSQIRATLEKAKCRQRAEYCVHGAHTGDDIYVCPCDGMVW